MLLPDLRLPPLNAAGHLLLRGLLFHIRRRPPHTVARWPSLCGPRSLSWPWKCATDLSPVRTLQSSQQCVSWSPSLGQGTGEAAHTPRPGARDTQALPNVQSVTLTLYEAGEAVGTWAG